MTLLSLDLNTALLVPLTSPGRSAGSLGAALHTPEWPTAELGVPGTWEVTYAFGAEPETARTWN